ncbi:MULTISPECIES: cbb3-type cytochrome c oxidase subunit 3 [Elizabethkingia]|uniref:Cbb3-type cytochrome oxidase component FixQ n=2 Tax=Elizabethkingia anophelis TaxID=1117645 RepID=X5KKF0_9FLAO|nr:MULTISPECIES: cbb3-type cytochrome c oxidase subunit 3 [Elizabethkingia]AKH96100.1 Cbb3-type cytochrome oxidase component FixQ [Elizabethkingia anophelis FMS-007]AQW94069.1 cytochrome C oxidase Cbb3 [Elizabethkingia anophelis]AQW97563.1 cytochrome C oxidase Cbb3 [Elizabethkingia anophelis]AQX01168.1 cytochrome C oxidase Cbb3 [Elizabethkingia anophelis]AQX88138.1 cytochrome C oxidase Cbb3 [Elizabethkingia anophelis]
MIPQNFKDILSNGENVGLYQTLALILFVLFFIGLVYVVFKKPKKYYRDRENAPLEDGDEINNKLH